MNAGLLPLIAIISFILSFEITAAFPHFLNTLSITSNSSSVTFSFLERADAPSPRSRGVLGITSITLASGIVFEAINSSVMPAAIDTRTLSAVTEGAAASMTLSIICGFTAKNIYLQIPARAASLSHEETPNSLRLSAFAESGS